MARASWRFSRVFARVLVLAPVLVVAACDGTSQSPPQTDLRCTVDQDGDGHVASACGGDDCADLDPAIHPGAADPGWVRTEIAGAFGGVEDMDTVFSTDGSWRLVTWVGGNLELVTVRDDQPAREIIALAGGREPHLLLATGDDADVLYRDPLTPATVLWARREAVGVWRSATIADDVLVRRFAVSRAADGALHVLHSTKTGVLHGLTLGASGVASRVSWGDAVEVLDLVLPAGGATYALVARFDRQGRERLAVVKAEGIQEPAELFELPDDRPQDGWSATLDQDGATSRVLYGRDPEVGVGLAQFDGQAPQIETVLPTSATPAVHRWRQSPTGESWLAAAADGRGYVLVRDEHGWTTEDVGEATRVFLGLDGGSHPVVALLREQTSAASTLAIARRRDSTGIDRDCDGVVGR